MFGIAPAKQWNKYHPAEKTFSYVPWAIIVTVMLVTGLIKAFRYLYPIPPTFVAQVTSVHDLFAIVSIVMLGLHLAAICLAPRNWPLLISMFTERVSRKHVQQVHPIWYKELTAREQAASPAAATQAAPKAGQAQAPAAGE
jgi:cytochrome b subunit of formate dehydrogenase